MKRRQGIAILLSAVLALSACLPGGSITAMATESSTDVSTEANQKGDTLFEADAVTSEEVDSPIEDEEEESISDYTATAEEPESDTLETSDRAQEAVSQEEETGQETEAVEEPGTKENKETFEEVSKDEEAQENSEEAVTQDSPSEEAYSIKYDSGDDLFSYIWNEEREEYEQQTSKCWTEKKVKGDSFSLFSERMESAGGKVLAGWSEKRDGERLEDALFTMPDHDVTLYAVWADALEVTLDANGGRFQNVWNPCSGRWEADSATIRLLVEKGGKINLYRPVSEDAERAFAGWSPVKDGSPIAEPGMEHLQPEGESNLVFEPEESCTLFAVWDVGEEVATEPDNELMAGTEYSDWNDKTCKITFSANGGYFKDKYTSEHVGISTYEVGKGKRLNKTPEEPQSDDKKKMCGWSREKDGVVEDIDFYDFRPQEDMTFYAVWEDSVEIIFDANGGRFNLDTDTAKYCIEGYASELREKHLDIPHPERAASIFSGWSLNADGTREVGQYLFDYKTRNILTGDMTLYAVWKETCIVTLKAEEGFFSDQTQQKTVTVEKGEKYRLPRVYAPSGRRFVGWIDEKTGFSVGNQVMEFSPGEITDTLFEPMPDVYGTLIKEDATFVAQYEDDKGGTDYQTIIGTVILDANGGHFIVSENQQVDTVEKTFTRRYNFDVPECTGPGGKTLAGWSASKDGKNAERDPSYVLSTYVKEHNGAFPERLYAVWSGKVKIILKTDEGAFNDGSQNYEEILEKGERFTTKGIRDMKPIPADNNRILTGWIDTATGQEYECGSWREVFEDMTLKAVWEDSVKITFRAGEYGAFRGSDSYWFIVRKGATLSGGGVDEVGNHVSLKDAPTIEDTTKCLDSWETEDGKHIKGEDLYKYTPDHSQTLTAIYKTREIYKVVFDANGGYIDDNDTLLKTLETDIEKGSTASIPSWKVLHNEDEKILIGWSLDSTGKTILRSDYIPTSDCTLYAVWSDSYMVTLDLNGGATYSGDKIVSVQVPIGEKLSWSGRISDRFSGYYPYKDYVFVGWSDSRNGDVKVTIQDLPSYVPAADTTLYAVYEKSVEVTLDATEGRFKPIFTWADCGKEVYRLPVGAKFAKYFPSFKDHFPSPSKGKKVFKEWRDKEGNTVDLETFVAREDTVLYAVYEDGYEVTFYSGVNGYYSDVYENFYNRGYTHSLEKDEKNREVICFNIRKGESLDKVHGMVMSSLANYYDIVSPAYEDEKLIQERKVQKPVLWFTDAGLTNRINPIGYVPKGDIKLYAGWSADRLVEKIVLDHSTLALKKGEQGTVKATSIEPKDAKNQIISWKSDNTKVATVDKNGVVRGIAKGKAVLTASATDGSGIKASCTVTVTEAPVFTDVSSKYAFAKEIQWAAENGIVSGYADGTFKPQDYCKRKQVVAFLWRLEGTPSPKSTKARFSDVSTKTDFYKAIYWATENSIVLGFGNGTFKPDATCTRGQVVAFLWRLAGRPAPKGSASKFSDVTKTNSFYKAILWASEKGIVNGYSDGTFKPDANCTRAQIVAFINRYAKQK